MMLREVFSLKALTIGLLILTLVFWGLGIWFGDPRWGGLGFITMIPTIVSAIVLAVRNNSL